MTLLIVGGLLIVALLAILGAVFLGRTDQRAARTQANGSVTVSTPGGIPLVQQSSSVYSTTEKAASLNQNASFTSEKPVSPITGDQQQFALNGQFHELTVELHALYQHAWELERRLRTLTDAADRIEKTPGNQIGTEEGTHTPSSAN